MSTQRISAERRFWLESRLSLRDRQVLHWVCRLRLATGQQLQTLCFGSLAASSSRSVVRGRVLGRLVSWGLLEVVDKRVGGTASGSSSPIYRLTYAGRAISDPAPPRAARPYTDRFTAHTLAISQVAADLVAAVELDDSLALVDFITEPASWTPDALGSYLKPDAYLQLQSPSLSLHYWLEMDLGTESLPALERKLRTYLDFVARGQRGPHELVPQVLIALSSDARHAAVSRLLHRLPEPAPDLFLPCLSGRAVTTMLAALNE